MWATGWLKGINLILLLSYLIVGMWALNWLLARRSVRGLRPGRRLVTPVFAQTHRLNTFLQHDLLRGLRKTLLGQPAAALQAPVKAEPGGASAPKQGSRPSGNERAGAAVSV